MANDMYSFVKDVFTFIWNQTAPAINLRRHFKVNIKELQHKLEYLQIEANIVNSIIETKDKEEGKVATPEVRRWLEQVKKAKEEAVGILRKKSVKTALRNDASNELENEEEEEPKKTTCGNGIFFFSRMNISEMAVEKCRRLTDLIDERPLPDALVISPPPGRVMVGPYKKLEGRGAMKFEAEVWKLLVEEEEWKMIGVHGKAKVGKTALMENINHRLGMEEERFDRVIWSSLEPEVKGNNWEIPQEWPKDIRSCLEPEIKGNNWEIPEKWMNPEVQHARMDLDERQVRINQEEKQVRMAISKIQDDIASRFGRLELHGDEKTRAQIVLDRLRKLKFVLILDHVEYALDLNRIGVPNKINTKKGSKVVIITRDYKICDEMVVDATFEVKCLADDEAWKLFTQMAWPKMKVSCDDDVDGIPKGVVRTARELARNCGGFPGEILTIAQLMKHNINEDDWIDVLRKYEQSKGDGMEIVEPRKKKEEKGETIPIWFLLSFVLFWGFVLLGKCM